MTIQPRARSRRVAATIVLLALPCTLFGVASAAPPPAPTITAVTPQPLTPYTSGGCVESGKPCYKVFGAAEPGAKILLTVRDELTTATATQTVYAAAQDDPGLNIAAGEWQASPNVTDLGTHGEGSSFLTFEAVAENANGEQSPVSSFGPVEKIARTPNDGTPPRITTTSTGPQGAWCHLGRSGFAAPVPGSPVPAGFCFPDSPIDVAALFAFRVEPSFGYGGWGIRQISGRVDDFAAQGSRGIASEIADVVVTIRNANGDVVQEYRSFTRRGMLAYYSVNLFITDFSPGNYSSQVTAVDAWGNETSTTPVNFSVMVM